MVAGLTNGELIAPMTYEETMTSDFFEAWFQKFLLPTLNTPSVIIMDNARFHRMGKLELLCEEFGHKLLPLPPYSPEYNPIEKTWAHIKKHLKKVLPSCSTFFEALLSYSCFNRLYIFQNILSILYSNGQPTFLSTVLSFSLTVVVGSILEELIHRGYFMNTFFPNSKYYLDVILSALIFGFSHLILSHRDPISLLYFIFFGFFFALVYRYTSNLRLTILCHCLFNFFNHAKPIWIFVYNFIYYRFFR